MRDGDEDVNGNQKGRKYLGELGVDGRVVGMGLEYMD
jgi:hypothetical protein